MEACRRGGEKKMDKVLGENATLFESTGGSHDLGTKYKKVNSEDKKSNSLLRKLKKRN